jgi:hypothetical protein
MLSYACFQYKAIETRRQVRAMCRDVELFWQESVRDDESWDERDEDERDEDDEGDDATDDESHISDDESHVSDDERHTSDEEEGYESTRRIPMFVEWVRPLVEFEREPSIRDHDTDEDASIATDGSND